MIKRHKNPILLALLGMLTCSHVTIPIHADRAMFRSQYSQRLQQSIDLLQRISCKKEWFFEIEIPGCDCTFVTHYQFQHREIAQCVAAMKKSKDFEPLIQISYDFTHHAHLHDDLFAREYLLLLFIAYRNLIINNAENKNKRLRKSVTYIMAEVYEAMESIPPDKILEAIELLAYELPSFLEQHEFDSDVSWKRWLKKYWWVPPVIFLIFGSRLLIILIEPPDRPRKRKRRKHRLRTPDIIDDEQSESS